MSNREYRISMYFFLLQRFKILCSTFDVPFTYGGLRFANPPYAAFLQDYSFAPSFFPQSPFAIQHWFFSGSHGPPLKSIRWQDSVLKFSDCKIRVAALLIDTQVYIPTLERGNETKP